MKSDTGTPEAILEVCGAHLTHPLPPEIEFALCPEWFLDLHFIHVADRKAEMKKLQKLESGLRSALAAIEEMHTDVRRSLEHQASANLRDDDPTYKLVTFTEYEGQRVPINKFDNVQRFIEHALAAYLGQPAESQDLRTSRHKPDRSAEVAAIQALSELNMLQLNEQAGPHDTWQRIVAVERCRELWSLGTGKQPPNAYSGPFGRFLADVITAIGKVDDWPSPESVFNAWKVKSQHAGWIF